MKTLILFFAFVVTAFCACQTRTGPPVWSKCHQQFSNVGSPYQYSGEWSYDGYWTTDPAIGSNSLPIVTYMPGCSFNAIGTCDQQTGDTGTDCAGTTCFAYNFVQNGISLQGDNPNAYSSGTGKCVLVCTGATNFYVIYGPMIGSSVPNVNVVGGNFSFVVNVPGGVWWPLATFTGPVSLAGFDASLYETVNVTGQVVVGGLGGTGTISTLLAIQNNHPSASTWVWTVNPNGALLMNSLAEFRAWGGSGATNSQGDWKRIYTMCFSSGCFATQLGNQLGALAYNSSNSQYTLANFNATKVIGAMYLSPPSDTACIPLVPGSQSINELLPFNVGVVTATSIIATYGPNACAVTGGNSPVTTGKQNSPVGCVWGSATCSYGTPPLLTPRQTIVTGKGDQVVYPWAQVESYFSLPSWQMKGQFIFPALTHTLDITGSGVDWAWPPLEATRTALGDMYSTGEEHANTAIAPSGLTVY